MKKKKIHYVYLKFVLHESEVISEAIYIQMKKTKAWNKLSTNAK